MTKDHGEAATGVVSRTIGHQGGAPRLGVGLSSTQCATAVACQLPCVLESPRQRTGLKT